MTRLTAERLRELLHYDPDTGAWTWLVTLSNAAPKGSSAGKRRVKIDGKSYLSHRLAVLYMTGEWPANEVDHQDIVLANNTWRNLRPADRSQNNANRRGGRLGRFYPKGVTTQFGKFQARISWRGKQTHLGTFTTIEDAAVAYAKAAIELHGEFARTGWDS
jgi:hypothetical protein